MNKKLRFSRRQMLIFASSSLIASPLRVFAEGGMLDIYVVKNAQCGCCDSWVEILSEKGFTVSTENRSRELLAKFKIKSGVPKDMMSCHTAKIMDYFIEGHVPTKDIKRLITERPNALGLAVPGMPYGSPGMGPEAEREAYDVFIIRSDGTPEVFQHYPKAGLLV
jgi:hypothetical protein